MIFDWIFPELTETFVNLDFLLYYIGSILPLFLLKLWLI
jgi:hypothetical protein